MEVNKAIEILKDRVKIDRSLRDKVESDFDEFCERECIAIETLMEAYKRLSIEAQATAFDEQNKDTEILLRVLLKQGQIKLENGEYKRKNFDWEENLYKLGLMKKREKNFYINDNLEEYTKQLENQLQEYNEIKEIFRKYIVFPNETIYDGCCKMQDEIDDLKEKLKNKEDQNEIKM